MLRRSVLLAGLGVLLLSAVVLADAGLFVEKPEPVRIKRGRTATIVITIYRREFNGPVQVMFDGLPRGVTAIDSERRISGNVGTYTFRAAVDAEVVTRRPVTVTVKGGEDLIASTSFYMTVLLGD
ncbi:MAG: hypothetical protein PHU85_00800 [Phycisphaerae bacterium]|nr:hypothetical protein [Phycisphaerae bacterium]